jgi:hypothetical protein
MNDTVYFTHPGKLGDFILTWPIAAWYYKTKGAKVHWVLPRSFKPFTKIGSLARLQEFTEDVTLVDFTPKAFGCGGQPWRFNPMDYGLPEREYRNFGLKTWPDKFITECYAEMHGFKWDEDWVLKLPDSNFAPEQDLYSDQLDSNVDFMLNACRMAKAVRRHCEHSSMACTLYFARIPFILNVVKRGTKQRVKLEDYFPDRTRYTLEEPPAPRFSFARFLRDKKEELLTHYYMRA